MVSALPTGWSSSALSLFQGHYVLSLGKSLDSHSARLSSVLMGTSRANAGGNPTIDIQ